MSDTSAFVEKQYLGREFIPLTIRLVMAVFCFAAYFLTDIGSDSNQPLAIVGFAIIIISIIMGFLPHFRTRVQNKSILLNGLWTSRLVKIDLNSIVTVERAPYSRYLLNNPVYNLHSKGTIRFYAGGREAIHLTDRDGLVYVIGTHHPNELLLAIQAEMKTK